MASISTMRWFDKSQPQTLQIAVMLLYFHVILAMLFGTYSYLPWGLVITVLSFAGAFGCANEKKWGYVAAIAAAVFPFAFRLMFWRGHNISLFDKITGGNIINVIFEAALVALVLHPMSRNYQRIWFK
jgi:hypothetical protein